MLTAAHCLVGGIERQSGQLYVQPITEQENEKKIISSSSLIDQFLIRVAVRLGEYDLANEIDCLEGKCADPVTSMGVEEKIPHPRYSERTLQNDIGLVRMDGEVTYTDYIKPICMPSTVNPQPGQANDILASAGWGRTLTSDDAFEYH